MNMTENTLPLIIHLDRSGAITGINEGLSKFLGISNNKDKEAQLIGRSIDDLCQDTRQQSLLKAITSMSAQEKVRVLKFALSYPVADASNTTRSTPPPAGLMYVVPSYENEECTGYIVSLALDEDTSASGVQNFSTSRQIAKWEQLLSIKNGIVIGVFFVALLMILGGVLGIAGLAMSSKNMENFVHENMNPTRMIGRINFLMADNRAQMALAMHHDPANPDSKRVDHSIDIHINTTLANQKEIFDLWEKYQAVNIEGEQKNISDIYWNSRLQYVNEGLNPMIELLRAGDYVQAQKHLLHNINPLYNYANVKSEHLVSYLTTTAEENYLAAAKINRYISIVATIGIISGLLIIIVLGFFFIQGSIKPLNASIQSLERIAKGDLSQSPQWFAHGEPGRVSASVIAMQVNLQSMIDDIDASSENIQQQCKQMNNIVMSLAERFEEQHDRSYQVLEIAQNSAKQMRTLAMQVEKITDTDPSEENTSINLDDLRNLASALSLEVFSAEEASMQMQQIADLIVDNRQEVQLAWAASEQLRETTYELDRLVGRFTKAS